MWTLSGTRPAKTCMYSRICFGPIPQFIPTLNIGKCDTAARNASNVCPVSVRPPMKIVVETITGTEFCVSSNTC